MLQLTAFMGTESPTMTPDQASLKAQQLAAFHLPNGHTVTECQGRWSSPDRGIVTEATVAVMVWAADRKDPVFKAFYQMCGEYKCAAAQDAVGVTVQEVDLDFV
ncbi:hypothetical protein SCRES3_gp66 [Synechococcus phage S-CRES3]|nr:hypothetical protein SCRES3_gp66 [Synechococcus phage S-CRES3]